MTCKHLQGSRDNASNNRATTNSDARGERCAWRDWDSISVLGPSIRSDPVLGQNHYIRDVEMERWSGWLVVLLNWTSLDKNYEFMLYFYRNFFLQRWRGSCRRKNRSVPVQKRAGKLQAWGWLTDCLKRREIIQLDKMAYWLIMTHASYWLH